MQFYKLPSFHRYYTNFVFIKQQQSKHNHREETVIFYTLLPYVSSRFLHWVKCCSGCFRQVFFSFGRQNGWLLVALDRWSSYTVTIVWDFPWADPVLVVLDKWSSYSGGCLNRFDCISICRFGSFKNPFATITSLSELYFKLRRFILLGQRNKNVFYELWQKHKKLR